MEFWRDLKASQAHVITAQPNESAIPTTGHN